MKELTVYNTDTSKAQAKHMLNDFLLEHGKCSMKLTKGDRRRLSQNNLFQHWARKYAAFIKGCDPKSIDEQTHERTKTGLKLRCYLNTGWRFMVNSFKDDSCSEPYLVPKSSAELEVGEMFSFMEWLQVYAAEQGLILESQGEYLKRQEAQNG